VGDRDRQSDTDGAIDPVADEDEVTRKPTVARQAEASELRYWSASAIAATAAAGVLVLVLVWSRTANLGVSFWLDEAYTAVHYVNRGPHGIFFGHYIPNDHVLFSLLAWATTSSVGRSEGAYRLWSVLPGLAAVGLAGWWMWRRVGPWAGVVVVALATVAPLHLELAPQARGYGLAFLAGAGMMVSAVRASDRGRPADVAVFAVLGLIGIWTLPVFALAFVSQAAVLLVRRDLRRATLVACAAVGVASVLFYAPLLDGILRNSQQQFGAQLPWYGWLSGPWQDLAHPTLAAFVPQSGSALASPLLAGVFVVLVALAARRCWRRGERYLLLHLTVPVVGTFLVLTLARSYVAARFISFLLFHVLVLLTLGIVELWEIARHVELLRLALVVVLVVMVIIGCEHTVQQTRRVSSFPIENFKLVARIVNASGAHTHVLTNSTVPEGLWYYLGTQRVSVLPARVLSRSVCAIRSPLVFVDHHFQSPEPNIGCLRRRGWVPIHVRQRRGSVDVWTPPKPT